MLYEIKTTKAPAKPGWLIIFDGEHIYLLPMEEFINIVIEAGRKFKTLVPLAPYPSAIGVVWKTNKRIYQWTVKQLQKAQEKYKTELGLDKEIE